MKHHEKREGGLAREGMPGRKGCELAESKNSLALRAAFPEVVPASTSHTEWHSK